MMPRSLFPLRYWLAVAFLGIVGGGPVAAQPDLSLKPSYGTVTLRAGFLPDPHKKDLTAGGTVKTNLGGVNAHVTNAPYYRLNYTKGSFPLTFHVQSFADTTLLINLPNGQWIADDDSGTGLNPLIRIEKPISGQYDIWIGTYGNKTAAATLHITELSVGGTTTPPTTTVVSAHERSTVFQNVIGQIRALKSVPVRENISGTYSTKHLFDTYSAGIHHPQGIAQLSDGRFVLSHDTRGDRTNLLVFDDGNGDTKMVREGTGNHPGAIQACGKVVIFPLKNDRGTGNRGEILFMDASDRNNPRQMPHLNFTIPDVVKNSGDGGQLNAAGIVYHPQHNCHYIITTHKSEYGEDPDNRIFKSNGKSLFDKSCRFSLVGKVKCFCSQGGMSLLYEQNGSTGRLYVAAMVTVIPREAGNSVFPNKRNGQNYIILSEIHNVATNPTANRVLVKDLGNTGEGVDTAAGYIPDYGANFRWGGTIGSNPNIEVFAVSRLLATAPTARHCNTRKWTQDHVVTLVHGGGYVAKFELSWTLNGKRQSWSSGSKTLGWRHTQIIPRDATNIRLHARAAVFISTWRDIIDRQISSGTHEVYGTTQNRLYKTR